ncbi:MAG TPA: radical SAM protein [Iamia sp.]|nr:radical SAM protein [Iamia sp.]
MPGPHRDGAPPDGARATREEAEQLKLALLASGLTITAPAAAALAVANGDRPLTPADYASTSGVILALEGTVWVNAPISLRNATLVEGTPFALDHDGEGLVVRGPDIVARAEFWLPPAYHGQVGSDGRPLNNYVFTHGDRVRLAPMRGCAMTCKFCNIPYEDRYDTKPIAAMVEAVRVALDDPVQPARHMLISGGTPKAADVEHMREVYRTVLTTFPDLDVDIMMVPVDGLFDLAELDALGVNELSINIEVHDATVAARLMRQKHRQGLDHYLRFIAEAAAVLGPGRVRSMLMVGLEDPASTRRGVQAILDAGGVPVLSPFRPDPATPLRDMAVPEAALLAEVLEDATALARAAGVALGPDCGPCSHNTLSAPPADLPARYPRPVTV